MFGFNENTSVNISTSQEPIPEQKPQQQLNLAWFTPSMLYVWRPKTFLKTKENNAGAENVLLKRKRFVDRWYDPEARPHGGSTMGEPLIRPSPKCRVKHSVKAWGAID